jgi:membrane peptidoglycan carboxypeptidase
MSTVFSEEINAIAESDSDIVPRPPKLLLYPMPQPIENRISNYVLRVMRENGWTLQDVVDNARRHRIKLSPSTLHQIVSPGGARATKNPGIYTLADVSKGLNRPFAEMVNEALGGSVIEAGVLKKAELVTIEDLYQQLKGRENKKVADRLIEMVSRELKELIRQQELDQ